MDITDFGAWLWSLVKAAVTQLFVLLSDVFNVLFDMVLGALAVVISALPSPSFMSQSNALGSLLSGLPSFTLYVIGQLHIPEAFAVVGAGVAFRLARKLATLGQW